MLIRVAPMTSAKLVRREMSESSGVGVSLQCLQEFSKDERRHLLKESIEERDRMG